jgi:hypothetical protein
MSHRLPQVFLMKFTKRSTIYAIVNADKSGVVVFDSKYYGIEAKLDGLVKHAYFL